MNNRCLYLLIVVLQADWQLSNSPLWEFWPWSCAGLGQPHSSDRQNAHMDSHVKGKYLTKETRLTNVTMDDAIMHFVQFLSSRTRCRKCSADSASASAMIEAKPSEQCKVCDVQRAMEGRMDERIVCRQMFDSIISE